MHQKSLLSKLREWIGLAGLIMIALIATMPDSAAFTDNGSDEIDNFVEAQMRELHIPGLALAIVQTDQITHLQGYGIADPSGRPVTPQTLFLIGSTTKSFTALAVMQLVEQGQLELDAPVQRYIPWFGIADPAASTEITVRDLLNQTSGISTADGNSDLSRDDTAVDALEQRARAIQSVHLSQPVGTMFQYTNVNYDLLGLLMEIVSGQSYEDYVEQHIFTPLDMRHSTTKFATAQANGLASGYRYWFGVPAPMKTPFPRGSLPSGYLMSSVEDLSHYLIAQLNHGRYGNVTVLSPDGIVEMHHPAVAAFDGNQYAMGWFVGQSGDLPVVWHNGTVPGFNAKMMLVPSQGLGVVALMNSSSQVNQARSEAIVDGVISLLQGRTPAPVPENQIASVLYAVICVIAIIPLINVSGSVRALRRWRANPSQHPRGVRLAWRIGIVFGLNLLVAFLFLIVQPQLFGIDLRGTLLLSPDIGVIMILGIIIALGWCILYPLLLWRLPRHGSTRQRID
jgi:CubicO group peptidase (beta-lactamase class C family)